MFFGLDWTNLGSILFLIFYKWTNLGPVSVDLIFYNPNVANLGFLRIVPTIALLSRQLHFNTEKVQVRGLAALGVAILADPMFTPQVCISQIPTLEAFSGRPFFLDVNGVCFIDH